MRLARYLGLAVIAALALTAFAGATSASAAGFTAGNYPASPYAEETQSLKFSNNGIYITCSGFGASASASINEAYTPSVTLSQNGPYTCSSTYGTATLTVENCTALSLTPGALGGNGKFTLAPSNCAWVLKTKPLSCTYKMGPQTLSTAPFTNEGSPSQVKVPIASSISFTLTEGTEKICGGGMSVEGTWRLKATYGGSPTSLSVDNKDGVFFNAGASQFQAEAYPVNHLQGTPSTSHVISIHGLGVKCGTIIWDSQLTAAAGLLSVNAAHNECFVYPGGIPLPTTINMNGCHYAFHAAGTADVVCNSKSEAIEIKVLNKKEELYCYYKIEPQEGLTGLTNGTVGSGDERGISLSLNLSLKVKNEKLNAVCGPSATETATYTGATNLYATP